MKLKKKIFLLIDEERGNKKGDHFVEYFICILILLNVITIFLESYRSINEQYGLLFYGIELVSIIVFSIEYIIRVWVADLQYPTLSPIRARLKYIFSFLGLVDLLSILPFYLPYLMKIDLRVVRVLRLLRLLRLLKLNRHSKSLRLIGTVLKNTKNDILVTVFMVFILLVLASTLMYNIENEAQPEAFNNIGQALWWAVATLTTVGYGDIYPITGFGKFLSGIIALLGIGIVALPTGIISSAYIEEVQKGKVSKECPHCGKSVESH
ncbi:potassium channel protein [Flavivirga aquatica]|uniref:Potassium channel protein n=1 Tax=Flavivirga aquatica TaxID=1849968 RepID=A0A1E5TDF8_9FLAO|nr:ion transporter [Flavivirga aquatica]OEK09390.1 potassium channel protein [Flavivirga aquatica]